MTGTDGLQKHDVFSKLTMDEIKQLDMFTHVREYAQGEHVFEYHQACTHVYMLMDGEVHLMLPAKGSELKLSFAKVKKDEIFGLSALMKTPRYTAEARCITDCRVMSVEAKPLLIILENNQMVGLDIVNTVSRIYYHRYLNMLGKLQDIVGQVSSLS